MIKSKSLNIKAVLGEGAAKNVMTQPRPSIVMRHADVRYWKHGNDEIIEQEFDGHLGYLYSYDTTLEQDISIPIHVEMGDLHVVYLRQGEAGVRLSDVQGNDVYVLALQRARYVYLAPGKYTVHVPKGKLHLFGFYFSVSIFRDGSEDQYPFIKPLIMARRDKSAQCLTSVDFKIGTRTEAYIRMLCSKIKKGDLDNETFILQQLNQLINLSREKVRLETDETYGKEKLVIESKNLIQQAVDVYGQNFVIEEIARQLDVSINHLCRVFKRQTAQTLGAYKSHCVLEKAKQELLDFQTLGDASERCGFPSVAAFSRFFKKQTGMTAKQFLLLPENSEP